MAKATDGDLQEFESLWLSAATELESLGPAASTLLPEKDRLYISRSVAMREPSLDRQPKWRTLVQLSVGNRVLPTATFQVPCLGFLPLGEGGQNALAAAHFSGSNSGLSRALRDWRERRWVQLFHQRNGKRGQPPLIGISVPPVTHELIAMAEGRAAVRNGRITEGQFRATRYLCKVLGYPLSYASQGREASRLLDALERAKAASTGATYSRARKTL